MSCNINPHIERYLDIVESGVVVACRDQIALCELVRRCFENEDIYTDSEQLEHYISLARYFPYERLFEWEEFVFALHLCTYWSASKQPRFPDLFCMLGRGSGKDGAIAFESTCLISPYNGIRAYDVDICANNEDQAMRPVTDVVEAFDTPTWTAKLKKHFYWTKEKVFGLKTKSTIRGHTNSPKGKDGLRSGVVILNEIHQYENYANINVFTTGLGKKKHPRRSYFTTNGNVREGPLDDMLDKSSEILFGGEPDYGLLPFICRLDCADDVHNPTNWEKAMPGLRYQPDLRLEVEKEYREWSKTPATLPDFMTKRMNFPDGSGDVAVTEYENIKATKGELPELIGQSCTVGIDYASFRDWASVNLHFRIGDNRLDINHSWLCKKSPTLPDIKAPWQEWERLGLVTVVDDKEISPELLAEYIAEAAVNYNILRINLDNFRYALVKKALMSIGFDDKDFRNIRLTRPSDIMKIQPVVDHCFTAHFFNWGDNPVLRWAANNTKLVRAGKKDGTDTGNFYYAKIEAKSRKTDPFMALVASMVGEDELESNSGELPDLGVIG